MAVNLRGTFESIAKGGTAVFLGGGERGEDRSFRVSLTRGCFYIFTFIWALMTIIRIIYPVHKIPIKWTWAELLMNYQGGFVRRGLLGEILFRLQPFIPAVVTASIIVFVSYCLFTYLVLKLLDDAPLVVFAFFVFSPAALLFPVYEPDVFARKEIFFLLAFVLLIFSYIKYSDYRVKVCSFVVLYAIVTLIHEPAVFFAPLAACLLVFSMKEHTDRFRLGMLCFLFLYVAALAGVIFFSVNPHYDPSAIVKSWSPYFPNVKTGSAFNYLNKGVGAAFALTSHYFLNWRRCTRPFLVDFCLAILPIILLLLHSTHFEFFSRLRKKEPLFFLLTIGSLLAPFVLFFLMDWGRVIYIISMQSFIFLVALTSLGLVEYKESHPLTKYQWKIYTLFFLYYTILWRMPNMR